MTHAIVKCISLPILNAEIYYFPDLRQSFPPHFHDALMLGCLLNGRREVEYAGSRHFLNPGECELVPEYAIHACKPAGDDSSAWICMHIRRFFPSLAGPLRLQDKKLYHIFKSLSAFERQSLQLLAQEALQHLEKVITALPPMSVQPICALENAQMPQDYATRITLTELAKSAQMTKYSYIREFKNQTGITPYRYLEAMRITSSQRLLRNGSALIDCALASGFYDQSHFSRCFKARLGITPGIYRAAYPASSL